MAIAQKWCLGIRSQEYGGCISNLKQFWHHFQWYFNCDFAWHSVYAELLHTPHSWTISRRFDIYIHNVGYLDQPHFIHSLKPITNGPHHELRKKSPRHLLLWVANFSPKSSTSLLAVKSLLLMINNNQCSSLLSTLELMLLQISSKRNST